MSNLILQSKPTTVLIREDGQIGRIQRYTANPHLSDTKVEFYYFQRDTRPKQTGLLSKIRDTEMSPAQLAKLYLEIKNQFDELDPKLQEQSRLDWQKRLQEVNSQENTFDIIFQQEELQKLFFQNNHEGNSALGKEQG